MNASQASSKTKENELFANDVQRLTKLHIKYVMFLMAGDRLKSSDIKDKKVRKMLVLLQKIFALKEIAADNTLLYETGFFSKGSL
jgi:hypothetical protein